MTTSTQVANVGGMPIYSPNHVKEGLEFLNRKNDSLDPSWNILSYSYGRNNNLKAEELEHFLGICLGSKRCKKKRAHRQDQRELRREAKTARIVARTQNVQEGKEASAGLGKTLGAVSDTVGNVVGILTGGAVTGAASGALAGGVDPINDPTSPDYDPNAQARPGEPEKTNNTTAMIIGSIVVVGVIIGIVFLIKGKKK